MINLKQQKMQTTKKLSSRKFVLLMGLVLMLFLAGRAHAQDSASLVKTIHQVLGDCTFHEVTEEMFATIAEDDRYRTVPEMADIRKIRYLILVDCNKGGKDFYQQFHSAADLKGFRVLIRSKSTNSVYTFYRKQHEDGLYEYLLIHNEGLSYIVTSLKISTLHELSAVMHMAGRVGNQ